MDESIGQALRAARIKRNFTVEEVARFTKIRPERINDLERDDYTRFPNLAYARNFLILYAKYLGVDISKYPTVEVGSTVGLGDYQYLRNEDAEKPRGVRQEPVGPPPKPRWLIVFFVFLAMLAIGALIGLGIVNFLRLGPLGKKEGATLSTPAPSVTPTPVPAETPVPTPPPLPSPQAETSPSPAMDEVPVLPAQPMGAPSPEPEVRRAEPIVSGSSDAALLTVPAPVPTPSSAVAFPPPGATREITVRVTKKIRVRIVHDNPKGSSDYLGFMYPAMGPKTFRGKYFWIKATDLDALQVTIDGQAAIGPESGVEISQVTGL